MKKAVYFLPFILLLLSACSKEIGGSAPEGTTAEGAALAFFDHIYNTRNMKGALRLASPRLQRLMKSYHTPKAVSRHVINLRYDGDVVLEIDGGNSVGRAEFATKQIVSIFLSGSYQGNVIDELRTVKLVREKGNWVVDEILADRFL